MRDTTKMAREAGAVHIHGRPKEFAIVGNDNIKAFEALVRADERNSWPAEMEAMERQVNILTDALAQEREACAKVCEEVGEESDSFTRDILRSTAAAIRARSNT